MGNHKNNFDNDLNDGYQLIKSDNHKKQRYEKDTKTRTRLAYGTSIFIEVYIICVCVLVWFTGLQKIKLSNPVFMTFLSTTTVNVLGLMYIILSGMFKKKAT